jgi:hypothetical protein
VIAGLVVFAGFVVWQQLMPAAFDSIRGINPRAAAEWRARFHLPAIALSLRGYDACFQALQVLSWVAYGVLVALVHRGARFSDAWTWRLATPLVVAVAVAMPASLSADPFAYVGYGRLAVVHGLNPHVATQVDLVRLGDPTTPYLHWPIASPYGPLWTALSIAVVAAAERLSPGAVWGPVLVFKLIAAAAVLGLAAATRLLVQRSDQPARANATFVLIATNPLLLCEGPGNGHNDLVMMALAMAGFVVWLNPAGSPWKGPRAALIFGVAAAVKVIPLLVLPWLLLTTARARAPMRALQLGLVALLGLAPIALAYTPFWAGGKALVGLSERWRTADEAARMQEQTSASAVASAATKTAAASHPPAPLTLARVGLMAGRTWFALLVYAVATALIFRRALDPLLPLTAWVYVSSSVMLFVAGLWFPWYLSWPWPAVLARGTRQHQFLLLMLFLFSFLLMMVYGVVP